MAKKKALFRILLALAVLLAIWFSTLRPDAREIFLQWLCGRGSG